MGDETNRNEKVSENVKIVDEIDESILHDFNFSNNSSEVFSYNVMNLPIVNVSRDVSATKNNCIEFEGSSHDITVKKSLSQKVDFMKKADECSVRKLSIHEVPVCELKSDLNVDLSFNMDGEEFFIEKDVKSNLNLVNSCVDEENKSNQDVKLMEISSNKSDETIDKSIVSNNLALNTKESFFDDSPPVLKDTDNGMYKLILKILNILRKKF